MDEAENLLDCAMTYSLFDWMKENSEEFIQRIPEIIVRNKVSNWRSMGKEFIQATVYDWNTLLD